MFTGIIQATAPVLRSVPSGGLRLVTVERPAAFSDLAIGASIACDGICLTVLSCDARAFTVEIAQETWRKTTASAWNAGTLLNLEPALRLGDRLDGHWVQGHVDRTTKLLETKTVSATLYLRFALDSRDRALVVPQGSIAVNGVSLTIADLAPASFSVALIAHTLKHSNLTRLQIGSAVNLEFDILGKYVRALQIKQPLTLEEKDA
ncbi:MAG TPA: riboflavin synthase [Candidatus Syntrophosphaera sp.]|nr:riboflavin synthase [Candidatus Syntrophosphaera sp.]